LGHDLQPETQNIMLYSYLKTALRALRNRIGLTAINITGLALGLASVLVIVLYARHELSYDTFHENTDRIHQVYKERGTPTGTQISRDTWVPLLPKLVADYPSVQSGTRVYTSTEWVERGGRRFEESVAYVDSTFREVFTFPLRTGGDRLLASPNTVLITPDVAQRHFGDTNPVGRTLTIDFDQAFTVGGVLEPIPSNSTVGFDIVTGIYNIDGHEDYADNWRASFLDTYILLDENAAPQDLEAQFPALVASLFGEEESERTSFHLQPLPTLQNALTNNHQIAYILLAVALAVIVIASINFTNLAVAQSLDRAREIGVRKALGAVRGQLSWQFLGEAVLMSISGMGMGVILAAIVLPAFNGLYGTDLGLHLAQNPTRILILATAAVGLGLITGAYPAFILSNYQPSQTLRGQHERSASGQFLRRGLVVVQFAMSMLLIVGTLAAWQQVDHMKDAPLGVTDAPLLSIDTGLEQFADGRTAEQRLRTFQEEIERLSSVTSASFGGHVPGQASTSFLFARPGSATSDDERRRMRYAAVDDSYFETLGVSVIAGRTFSQKRASDSSAVVLNRAAAKDFGWGTDAVGKTLRIGPDRLPVIGVVEDYRYQSAREAVEPIIHIFGLNFSSRYNVLAVQMAGGDPGATLAQIREKWSAVTPSLEMSATFVDQRFQQLYEREENLATVAGAFTMLSAIIACLGLLGLSAVAVARRRKEIGIRKALGASVVRVAVQMGKDYVSLVAVAIVLGAPLAYVVLDAWLADFAVRIDLGLGLFAGAAACALGIAVLTVGTQTVRAARLNPASTLRDE
jgi:putative ABC transport system permease protein